MTQGDPHDVSYFEQLDSDEQRSRIDRLVPYFSLEPAMAVLDVGCGQGLLIEFVAPLVDTYVGCDTSAAAIQLASHRAAHAGNAQVLCADVADVPGHYDVAFALDVSEHVEDERWLQILKSIREKSDRLFIHTPNGLFLPEWLRNKGLARQRTEHIAVRSVAENEALLREAGYVDITVRLLSHYTSLRLLHPFSYLPIISRFFQARIFIESR